MSVITRVYGERVRQARTLSRMTATSVAKEMRWSPPSQTRLEQSLERDLPAETVRQLSSHLNVTPAFLAKAPSSPLGISDLRFRAPKSTAVNEKHFLVEMARLSGEFAEWLDGQHHLPPVRLPRLRHDDSIETAAQVVRAEADLSATQPVPRLLPLIERRGGVVVMRSRQLQTETDSWAAEGDFTIEAPERGERHFGASAWTGSFSERPVIVMRSIKSWERIRWTLAHELGHLVLHHETLPIEAEMQASRFASEFLAPASALRKELTKHVTLIELVNVKLKYGISLGALIRHLDYSGLVSEVRAQALRDQLYTRIDASTGRTWGAVEPGRDAWRIERPQLLRRWLQHCTGTSTARELEAVCPEWPAWLMRSVLSETAHGPQGRSVKPDDPATSTETNAVLQFRAR